MKLLQVNNVASVTGGTGAAAQSIVRALPYWQHAVVFAPPGPVTAGLRAAFGCDLYRGLQHLDAAIESFRPDVLLFHNLSADRMPQEMRRGIRTVYYQHSALRSATAARRPCDVPLTVSHYLARLVGLRAGDVLYQPVDCPPRPEIRDGGVLRVGRLCTPSRRKWEAGEVLPLYAQLAARHPDVAWEFVGCPPDLRPALDAACRARAVFYPPSWEARRLLWRWGAMLYASSLPETYGRTVCEAQLAGCVPIVSRRGGFIEQIDHGATGFLCDSPDEFSAAVAAVSDPRARHDIASRSRDAGTARGSPDQWREEFAKRVR